MAACQEARELLSHAILHDPAITKQSTVAARGRAGAPALYVLRDGYAASRRIDLQVLPSVG